jgi:short-subunit dehydrogenase involved in D-alanine esterification of teichoic acids
MTMLGKRVLITGGGSGAGESLALGFAAQGAEVVIAGRRMDALQSVAAKAQGIPAAAVTLAGQSYTRCRGGLGAAEVVKALAEEADNVA